MGASGTPLHPRYKLTKKSGIVTSGSPKDGGIVCECDGDVLGEEPPERVTVQRGSGVLPVSGGIVDEKQATAPIETVTSRLRTDSEPRGSRENVTCAHDG